MSSATRQYAGALPPLAAVAGTSLQAGAVEGWIQELATLLSNSPLLAILSTSMTLLIGGALTVGESYTDRTTTIIRENPVRCFFWGAVIYVGVVVIAVALALTMVGLVVALPLAALAGTAFLIWGQLGLLGVGRIAVEQKWLALGVAVVLSFLTGIVPVAGPILGSVLYVTGLGAGFIDLRQQNRSKPDPEKRPLAQPHSQPARTRDGTVRVRSGAETQPPTDADSPDQRDNDQSDDQE